MSDAHPHIYDHETTVVIRDWRSYLPEGVRPYLEPAPLAALFLGISSGATFAMIRRRGTASRLPRAEPFRRSWHISAHLPSSSSAKGR